MCFEFVDKQVNALAIRDWNSVLYSQNEFTKLIWKLYSLFRNGCFFLSKTKTNLQCTKYSLTWNWFESTNPLECWMVVDGSAIKRMGSLNVDLIEKVVLQERCYVSLIRCGWFDERPFCLNLHVDYVDRRFQWDWGDKRLFSQWLVQRPCFVFTDLSTGNEHWRIHGVVHRNRL